MKIMAGEPTSAVVAMKIMATPLRTLAEEWIIREPTSKVVARETTTPSATS